MGSCYSLNPFIDWKLVESAVGSGGVNGGGVRAKFLYIEESKYKNAWPLIFCDSFTISERKRQRGTDRERERERGTGAI